MRHIILPVLLLFGIINASGQSASGRSDLPVSERRDGELLVQLSFRTNLQHILALLNKAGKGTVQLKKTIAKDWNIHLLSFDESQVAAADFLNEANLLPGILSVQFNHRTLERSTEPNDPEWWRQDDMTLIAAQDAWDVSTGGLTPAGDTIVVAVLEKGALLTHPDLAANRWYNWAEIPENGVDDDNNGYTDDFGGWDARNGGDGTGANNNHGTAVNGIIGAHGNNATGVTGVNWSIKLMNLSNVEFEDEIVEAYYYVGKTRQLYNQTNGTKGAFVVATNASFGLDKQKAEDHPLWCAVYDSLGKAGIIGVGATTNQNTNVDTEGDMPTSCTSEFLISVNNTDKFGNKMPATGYGTISIDLGAPGNGTYSTANNGVSNPGYGTLGGTSSATPHVTGAVGLLYSMSCNKLTSDALSDPVACARRVRDIILNHVEPNATLQNKTTTGGYLHLGHSAEAVRDLCDGLVGTLDIFQMNTIGKNHYQVYYQTPTFEKYYFRVFNMLGQLMHEEEVQPVQFGVNYWEYDANSLPAGVYVMSIMRGKIYASRKFPKI